VLNVICETESSVEAAETGETSRDFILRGRDKNPLNIFLHWLFSSTLLTQLKPPEASEQAAKKVEGAALELPPGLTRPGPCEPKF